MKSWKALLMTSLLFFSLLTACSMSDKSEKSISENKTITFALLAPLTGQNAEYGKGFEVSTKMAVDEINSKGGVQGYKLQIKVGDSKGEPKESSDLCRQFIDDKTIAAIIGDFTSGASMANAPIVDEGKIVQISPTASNPDYAGMSPFTFSIMGRQDGEGPFFSTYILKKKMGAQKIGVIYVNSDWGLASYNALTGQMQKDGLDLVASAEYVTGETDFSTVVSKVQAEEPDTVVILDQGAVPYILNQIHKVGWTDVKIATLGPGSSQQLIDLTGEASENLYTSTPFFFNPDNENDEAWRKTFLDKAGFEPTVHPVCAYDCVYILAKALENVPADVLASNDIGALRLAIRDAVQNIEIEGMTGPIKFNENGDITRAYIIAQVQKGKWVMVEGYDYATK